MNSTINIGIIGAGNIAHKFKDAVDHIENASVTAIASKDMDRARKWAADEHINNYYGNYDEMLKKADIDLVYIATTNNFHAENIKLCLTHNKHVMCEKPLAMTYNDAAKLTNYAKAHGLFLMECMWSRFLPKSSAVKNWIDTGRIGTVKLMQASIGWVADPVYNSRLFKPELGGGSMYDLCVYPLELLTYYSSQHIKEVHPVISYHETGVDDLVNLNLTLDSCLANIQCSFTTKLPEDAYIYGDAGYIRVPKLHFGTDAYLYDTNDTIVDRFTGDASENGFSYEIKEAIECIQSDQYESLTAPHSMTLETCSVYDICLDKTTTKTFQI